MAFDTQVIFDNLSTFGTALVSFTFSFFKFISFIFTVLLICNKGDTEKTINQLVKLIVALKTKNST